MSGGRGAERGRQRIHSSNSPTMRSGSEPKSDAQPTEPLRCPFPFCFCFFLLICLCPCSRSCFPLSAPASCTLGAFPSFPSRLLLIHLWVSITSLCCVCNPSFCLDQTCRKDKERTLQGHHSHKATVSNSYLAGDGRWGSINATTSPCNTRSRVANPKAPFPDKPPFS